MTEIPGWLSTEIRTLGFEEQKNPALKDGIRHRIQNLRSLKQKTDGASRSSAQIENIKRQSLNTLAYI